MTTNSIVLIIIAATVCACMLVTTVGMVVYAPAHGVNEKVAGMVYDLLKVFAGGLIAAISLRGAGQYPRAAHNRSQSEAASDSATKPKRS